MKFTILYERSVRVREYETLKIGLWKEFNDKDVSHGQAFKFVKACVEHEIKQALRDLRD